MNRIQASRQTGRQTDTPAAKALHRLAPLAWTSAWTQASSHNHTLKPCPTNYRTDTASRVRLSHTDPLAADVASVEVRFRQPIKASCPSANSPACNRPLRSGEADRLVGPSDGCFFLRHSSRN